MAEPAYPYDLLAGSGIVPATPAGDFLKAEVPTRGEANRAWRFLRDLPARLLADFYLYRAADGARLGAFHEALFQQAGPADDKQVQRLDEASPILLLMAEQRDQAEKVWEEIQRQPPEAARIAHYLALLYHANAQRHEAAGDYATADAAWPLAIAHWIRTLADDAYWEDWCDERQRVYGSQPEYTVAPEERAAVREKLRRRMADEFLFQAERHARAQRPERAQRHRQWEVVLEAEWLGALAAKEASTQSALEELRVPGGLEWVRHMGLESRLATLVSDIRERMKQPTLDLPDLLRRLHLYFSQLAVPAALFERGKPRESLQALQACRDKGFDNDMSPAYVAPAEGKTDFLSDAATLAVEAHLTLSRDRITATPPDLPAARAEWENALSCGREGGLQDLAAAEIAGLVLARVNTLREQTGVPQEVGLSQAIEILDPARDCLRECPSPEIDAALGECLNLRGWQHFLDDRFEAADEDLRRACDLFRDNTEFLNNWCQNRVGWAVLCGEQHQKAKARGLLADAKKALQTALYWYPSEKKLMETAEEVDREISILSGTAPETGDVWKALDEVLHTDSDQPAAAEGRNRVPELIVGGEEKRRCRDFAGAERDLQEALRLDGESSTARLELAQSYRDWANDLLFRGLPKDARAIVERASKSGLTHPEFANLERQIEVFEELFGGLQEE